MLTIKYLNVPLGVDSTPKGQRKEIAPLVAASLASAGSSILSSILSASAQGSANKANLQATRETNDMNYKIANETNQMSQAQFDKNMNWLREQYYDTDQLVRLKSAASKAGFNPALAMGNVQPIGSVGQASPTQFHAAQMEAGHVDPISYDGLSESVGSAADAYYDNKLKSEQAKNVHADSLIKQAQGATEFMSRIADIRSKYADIELKLSQKGVNEETRKKLQSEKDKIDGEINLFWTQFMDIVANTKHQNRVLGMQEKSLEQDTIGKEIENRFKPMVISAGIRLSDAQTRSAIEHLKLIAPTITQMIAEGKLKTAQATGQYIVNLMNNLDVRTKARLSGLYDSNKVTRGVADVFQMLGDLLFGQVKFGFNGKY